MIILTKYTVNGTQFQTANFLHAAARAKTTATRKAPGIIMANNQVVAKVRKNGLIVAG
jgi:hypothetical protein